MRLSLLLTVISLLAVVSADAQQGKPTYVITATRSDTTLGRIVIELFPDIAPLHVRNFDSLVAIDFFDGTAFHRVIPGFVIQGGDPNTRSGDPSTWGQGDPSQANVPAEFNPISHQRGILSAARSNDPNSATSQFFIVVAPATSLDRRYTVYGQVLSGMNIVDSIVRAPTQPNQFGENSRPIDKITMTIERTGIDTSIPGRPTLLNPADDTTRIRAQQELRWARMDEAVLYEVQVSKSADFSTIALRDSVATTTYSARPLELGHVQYYWRVRASNGGRRGEWSDTRSFTTSIAVASLQYPRNGDSNIALPTRLIWNTVAGAVSYRVQIATSVGFTTIVADSAGIVDTTYLTRGLEQYPRLFWRVFATDGVGDTTQSPRWNFLTSTSTSVEYDAARASTQLSTELLRVSADRFTLVATLTTAATLDVSVVDVTGRTAVVVTRAPFAAGRNVVEIDMQGLPTGTYIVRTATGSWSSSDNITIVR